MKLKTILKIAGITGIAVGAIVGITCLIPSVGGFGLAGVGAMTAAAALQSSIGNVAAGSLFALLTSLGMKGVFIGGILGGVSLLASGFVTWILTKIKLN
jgi:hypothetical protein